MKSNKIIDVVAEIKFINGWCENNTSGFNIEYIDGYWQITVLGFDTVKFCEERKEIGTIVSELVKSELSKNRNKKYISNLSDIKERKKGCEYIVVSVKL